MAQDNSQAENLKSDKDVKPEEKQPEQVTPPVADAQQKYAYVPLPAGGLSALALELYPDDKDDPDKMKQHVQDLLLLNQNVMRTPDTAQAGQSVKVPQV